MNARFWEYLDQLIAASQIVIDRPKNSPHPRCPELTYPLNYGYLENTTSMDGGGIDLWTGSTTEYTLTGILVTVDLFKHDSEIKLLLGCTPEEVELILQFHNSDAMQAEYFQRPEDTYQ